MKIIITEEQFKLLKEQQETYTGQEVAQYIIDVTPDDNDVPDYFLTKFILPNDGWTIQEIDLNELLESDPSFKEYYESGEIRYEYDEVDPSGLDNYLVVYNGELLDGYSRASEKLNNGETYAYGFVLNKANNNLDKTHE